MKNLTLIILITLHSSLFTIHSFSQPCLPQGITFSTQAQIDNFQSNYPGCTEIEGDVIINGIDISNLSGLNVLTAIGGDFLIYGYSGNPLLTSLTGLDNLTSIGGNLSMGIFDNLYAIDNYSLTSITALVNLTSIGGSLVIAGNPLLTSLNGLESVSSIGGNLFIVASAITNLNSLENLTSIPGNITLGIDFPYGLGNLYLNNLSGLENLTSIGGSLRIQKNPVLSSLTGLGNISSIGEDIIICGVALTNLTGFENLTSIQGSLHLGKGWNWGVPQSNPNLISLTGLENVTSIGGRLDIELCPVLTSLTGLENVTSIGGVLYIAGNDSLTSLTGLGNVASSEHLVIVYNGSLTSLTGLEGLNAIGGDLWIGEPEAGNSSLTSLSGLENMTSIGGDLYIYDNDSLTSLMGLENIDAGSIENLYIKWNDLLSTCNVQSICDYLASPNGTIQIYGNAPGCYSPAQVQTACETHCLPEGITFSTQVEIDSFQVNYPGCTEIEGDVEINGIDISNLSGLNALTAIGGDFLIGDSTYGYSCNPLLTILAGLDNLTSIAGDLNIVSNNALTSLGGLESLNSLGGTLKIGGNNSLITLEGLCNLNSIGGDFLIGGFWEWNVMGNASLTSLTGLENITSIVGSLSIDSNPALSSLAGLQNLTSIGGDLFIGQIYSISNSSLTSLAGLESLTSIQGSLILGGPCGMATYWYNPNLVTLSGLDNLTSIGENLIIEINPVLTGLTGLENLTSIGGHMNIRGNGGLTSLAGLESLIAIGGNLRVETNSSISSLNGLENLMSIGGDLTIGWDDYYGNPALTSIAGLENIEAGSIENLRISGNELLSNCDVQNICDYLVSPNGIVTINNNAPGCNSPEEVQVACDTLHCLLEGITFATQVEIDSFQVNYPGCIEIAGEVTITGDDINNLNGLSVLTSIGENLKITSTSLLNSLTGLDSVNSIGGLLRIEDNNTLNSLSGLENVTSIGIYLWIKDNAALTTLSGLNNLSSIGGLLKIDNNDTLTSLTGLENIDAGSIGNLHFENNELLSNCDVQSICEYLATSSNGMVTIENNAPDCNSQQEVEEACWTSVDELSYDNKFNIVPNPIESTTLIEYTLLQNSPITIKIHDLSGREMVTLVNEVQQQGEQQVVFNTGGLPAGVYFCVLKTNNGMQTRKIIKL